MAYFPAWSKETNSLSKIYVSESNSISSLHFILDFLEPYNFNGSKERYGYAALDIHNLEESFWNNCPFYTFYSIENLLLSLGYISCINKWQYQILNTDTHLVKYKKVSRHVEQLLLSVYFQSCEICFRVGFF